MGLDISYQALPADCTVLKRARRDPKFGAYLESFKSFATASQYRIDCYAGEPTLLDFIAQSKQLLREYPGLEKRNLWGGRSWDRLHYLLSEKRRQGDSQDENDWARRALLGGDVLNPQTQTTIGIPIRYLAPDEVRAIAKRLSAISGDELRRHWNVKAMLEAAVYKIHPEDDEQTLSWIESSCRELAEFYALVVRHDEGVLVCLG